MKKRGIFVSSSQSETYVFYNNKINFAHTNPIQTDLVFRVEIKEFPLMYCICLFWKNRIYNISVCLDVYMVKEMRISFQYVWMENSEKLLTHMQPLIKQAKNTGVLRSVRRSIGVLFFQTGCCRQFSLSKTFIRQRVLVSTLRYEFIKIQYTELKNIRCVIIEF